MYNTMKLLALHEWLMGPDGKSPSVHVHIQIQLGAQIEVEECIDSQQEDQNSHNDQYDVLQSEKKKNGLIFLIQTLLNKS